MLTQLFYQLVDEKSHNSAAAQELVPRLHFPISKVSYPTPNLYLYNMIHHVWRIIIYLIWYLCINLGMYTSHLHLMVFELVNIH